MTQPYKLLADGRVTRIADGAILGADPTVAAYADYLAWAAAGNLADRADPVVAPVPSSISRRQFYQQLAIAGIATQDEAIAALSTGTLPAALATIVNGLPSDQQFGARMLLIGGTDFLLAHPLTAAIVAARGMSSADRDAFFTAAAAL
jgi:hypothetical protein